VTETQKRIVLVDFMQFCEDYHARYTEKILKPEIEKATDEKINIYLQGVEKTINHILQPEFHSFLRKSNITKLINDMRGEIKNE
jgi:hypothetical protein